MRQVADEVSGATVEGLCPGTCSSPVGSQQDRVLPLGASFQSKEKAGREARPEELDTAHSYGTVLDQAEVSPDSKPLPKTREPSVRAIGPGILVGPRSVAMAVSGSIVSRRPLRGSLRLASA